MSKTRHYIDSVKNCEKSIKACNKALNKISSRQIKLSKKINLSEEERVLLDELDRNYNHYLESKVRYEFKLQLIKLAALEKMSKVTPKAEKMGLDNNGYGKYLEVEYLTKLNRELQRGHGSWVDQARNEANTYIKNGTNGRLRLLNNYNNSLGTPGIFSDVEMEYSEANKIARR